MGAPQRTFRKISLRVLACTSVICNYITKSPKHLDDYPSPETLMNAQISTKLTAIAVALMMNGLLIGGVAYLFGGPLHQHAAAMTVAHAAASTLNGVA